MHALDYKFTDKKISPWGGIRIVQELYRRCGLKGIIGSLELPQPGSNRGYDPVEVIEGFMVSVLLGAKRIAHAEVLRHDEVIRDIFNWKKGVPSQSTFSRFFRKYDMEANDRIFPSVMRQWFEQFALDKVTIDIDSTVISRYGTQEGVEVGYNSQKPGRGSHHPILAFVSELNMVANAWMRPGKAGAATDFEAFLDELLTIIPREKIGLIRADSGFYGKNHLNKLEKEGRNYVIAAHLKGGLRAQIFHQEHWYPLLDKQDIGIDYCSFTWKAHGWKKARRFVVLRKDVDRHPKTGGKLLFPELEAFESYKYVAFVTNMDLSSKMIWQIYNQRADCENRIKELKYDYGIEGFCFDDLYATENAFRWVMVIHNLMALFKLELLKERKHRTMLSTLNFQFIAIGSYLSKSARKTILNLSVKEKRKRFIEGLFSQLSGLSPPFTVSIE